SLSVGISIAIWVCSWIKLACGLFCYARGGNECFIARTEFSGLCGRRNTGLGGPLSYARAYLHADQQFGDPFAKQGKRWNEHPEPPKLSRGRESPRSERNQHEPEAHKDLTYRIGKSGRTAVFEITPAMPPVPSVGSFW